MAFRDWLRNQQEQSEKRKRLFEGRTSLVPASKAWGGYQDRGQRLMTRQRTPPPASVTVTEKNDGTRTKVTKWEPDKASRLKVSGIADEGYVSRGRPIPPPANQRNPFDMPIASLPLSPQMHTPRMRGDIGATESIGVADPNPRPRGMPDVSNQRAMYHALRKPRPQVVPPMHIPAMRGAMSNPQQTQQNIWGSRFVPNPAPMIRKERNAPPMIGKERMDEDMWKWIRDRIYGGNY